MDPSKRNAAALHERVDEICDSMTKHFSAIVGVAGKPVDTDYSATAHNELSIEEESTALVRSTQDMSTLIRDLQELWLFGALDTLTDPSDEEGNRANALKIAAMIEKLVKSGLPTSPEDVQK